MDENQIKGKYRIVIIGGSAGCLEALMNILKEIQYSNLAIIVVVHRKENADSLLVDLLDMRSDLQVKEAEDKELIEPGKVYVAPAGYHLLIEKNYTMSLDDSEKVNYSRPSIDVTMECGADAYGDGIAAILLSGGNADGVNGLNAVKRAGGICIVQDPSTAVVGMMPQHAISAGVVDWILTVDMIGAWLKEANLLTFKE